MLLAYYVLHIVHVMLWKPFSFSLAGRVNAIQYNIILTDHLLSLIKHFSPEGCILFYNDANLIHRTWVFTEWFAVYENDANHILWPPQSSNLNPIEHVWAILGMIHSALHYRHQNTDLSWKSGVYLFCFFLWSCSWLSVKHLHSLYYSGTHSKKAFCQ